jgi:hypothetical protein
MSPNSGSSAEDVRCSECNISGCDSGNSVVLFKHAGAPSRPGEKRRGAGSIMGLCQIWTPYARLPSESYCLGSGILPRFCGTKWTTQKVACLSLFLRVDFLGLSKCPKFVRCWLRRARAATTSVPCSQHSGCIASLRRSRPKVTLFSGIHLDRSLYLVIASGDLRFSRHGSHDA